MLVEFQVGRERETSKRRDFACAIGFDSAHSSIPGRIVNIPQRYLAQLQMRCLTATPSVCTPVPMALALNHETFHQWLCEE